jgi:hypothetical protein
MHADDSDRAAILARRQRFILLALTGVAPLASACTTPPQPCLSVGRPEEQELDPTTTICPAEIGEPVSLLNGTQIRLPEGVTPEALEEINPDFVQLPKGVESVSCIDEVPGGVIQYFAMTSLPDDPNKSMPMFLDEFLARYGYGTLPRSAEVDDENGRRYEVVIDLTGEPGRSEPYGRVYLRLVANGGRVYALMYEAHPSAWSALEASMRASAASLSFVSP